MSLMFNVRGTANEKKQHLTTRLNDYNYSQYESQYESFKRSHMHVLRKHPDLRKK